MKEQASLVNRYQSCWDCLLRVLRSEDPMSFRDALKIVRVAQKDSHYRHHR
jgi:hypothetical protein